MTCVLCAASTEQKERDDEAWKVAEPKHAQEANVPSKDIPKVIAGSQPGMAEGKSLEASSCLKDASLITANVLRVFAAWISL